jgi:hypothetical protein
METALLVARHGNLTLLEEVVDLAAPCIHGAILFDARPPEWLAAWGTRAFRSHADSAEIAALLFRLYTTHDLEAGEGWWGDEAVKAAAQRELQTRISTS